MAKTITCPYCGAQGIAGGGGLHQDQQQKSFKRVGRNHFSGHLHVRCPDCGIVQLMEPERFRSPEPLGGADPRSFDAVSEVTRHAAWPLVPMASRSDWALVQA